MDFKLLLSCKRRINLDVPSSFFFQLRLDFDTFTISGPSTLTTSVSRRVEKSGEIIYQVNKKNMRYRMSLQELLKLLLRTPVPWGCPTPASASSTSSAWATPPGPLRQASAGSTRDSTVRKQGFFFFLSSLSCCTYNVWSFLVYVESSKCCNELAFKLGTGAGTSGGTSVATRSWQIKVLNKTT